MQTTYKYYAVLLPLLCLLSACQPDDTGSLPNVKKGVYIVNEGNFNFGNADVSFYDPATNQVSNNLFQTVNNYGLGDVAQSMFIKDSTGFVVVNNSAKVEVVHLPSFRKKLTINIAGSSPRHILPVNDSVAYVTELYADKIHVVNYLTGQTITEIATGRATEQLLLSGGWVYAEGKKKYGDAVSKGAFLRINPVTHSMAGTYIYSGNTGGIVADAQGKIWVLTSRDSVSKTPAALHCYNPDYTLAQTYSLGNYLTTCFGLSINSSGNALYFISKDIYVCANIHTSISPLQLVAAQGANFYSLGVDPATGDVYAADALDYVQPSRIYRYSSTGSLIHSFTAGVITGNFAFRYE